jgi:hypothetical protein
MYVCMYVCTYVEPRESLWSIKQTSKTCKILPLTWSLYFWSLTKNVVHYLFFRRSFSKAKNQTER